MIIQKVILIRVLFCSNFVALWVSTVCERKKRWPLQLKPRLHMKVNVSLLHSKKLYYASFIYCLSNRSTFSSFQKSSGKFSNYKLNDRIYPKLTSEKRLDFPDVLFYPRLLSTVLYEEIHFQCLICLLYCFNVDIKSFLGFTIIKYLKQYNKNVIREDDRLVCIVGHVPFRLGQLLLAKEDMMSTFMVRVVAGQCPLFLSR